MTLAEFAERYRVKLHHPRKNKPDRWRILHGEELAVPGRFGEIVADFKGKSLHMRLTAVPRNRRSMNKALHSRAQRAVAGGMVLYQKNGYETVWWFDPTNDAHCRLAIELRAACVL